MIYVPINFKKRVFVNLKKYQKIVERASDRDLNESDTSLIIADIICDLLGYDKYTDITTEEEIQGTYCDYAVMQKGKIKIIIEVKAIGIELKDIHVKQAIDYAANKGVNWVILTNGKIWRIYRVSFSKPICKELVTEIDFTQLNTRKENDLLSLYSISKDGLNKMILSDYYEQKQTTNKYVLGKILLDDEVIQAVRRKLRKSFPKITTKNEEIKEALKSEVIKREIFESDESKLATRKVKK